jgi:uncharacterized protein
MEANLEKQFYVFRGIDHVGSQEIRERWLAEHKVYMRTPAKVKLLHGGPLYNADEMVIGSCLIVEADSKSDVESWLSDEPFCRNGLFATRSVDRWGWSYGR